MIYIWTLSVVSLKRIAVKGIRGCEAALSQRQLDVLNQLVYGTLNKILDCCW